MIQYHKTYWNQRAKTKHLNMGDTNSGYFHKVASGRRNRKFLKEFKTATGTVITGEENIQKEIHTELKKRYDKEQINQITLQNYLSLINAEITQTENEKLTRAVTNEEVRKAIFSIGKDKSPGPDGFTDEFSQTFRKQLIIFL